MEAEVTESVQRKSQVKPAWNGEGIRINNGAQIIETNPRKNTDEYIRENIPFDIYPGLLQLSSYLIIVSKI